jgi:60 kDa SS-A/Ro ribonucleoprotein
MMASNNLAAFSTRNPVTPQGQKAVKGQKKNNAGGYTFVVSPLDRAKRFLILGSEDSFYMTGTKLTAQNAKNLIKLIEDGHSTELVDLIVTVSTEGRAAKQDPGVFALAVASAHGTVEERAYALSKLPEVARTATTLFMFIGFVQQFRGWGPALRRAVANWYLDKDADKLAFQVVKYRQREGYTHRDAFRLAHPKTTDAAVQGLGEWILRGTTDNAPKLVKGFVKAQKAGADLPKLIAKYNLTWEMLPTDALNDKKVWETLLADPKRVPLGALIRQLPRLSRIGITPPLGGMTEVIVERFADAEEIVRVGAQRAWRQHVDTFGTHRGCAGQGVLPLVQDDHALGQEVPDRTGRVGFHEFLHQRFVALLA